MVLWNYQSRQMPQLAPWVPTSAVFVPRRVWILELNPRDPYSATGREILMVDQQTLLPVYKLVYDRIGEYRKTVIGAWGRMRSKDNKLQSPFCAFVLAVDQSAQSATVLATQQVQVLRSGESKAVRQLRSWLEPSSYPQLELKKEEAPAAPPAEDSEAPASIDD